MPAGNKRFPPSSGIIKKSTGVGAADAESIFIDRHPPRPVKRTILDMCRHGILCSMDDFGFESSLLALLKEFNMDLMKLDREFFMDGL